MCEDLLFPLAHAGDKRVKRFHFCEIIGRLLYMRAVRDNISFLRRLTPGNSDMVKPQGRNLGTGSLALALELVSNCAR
jgi:hypothetical protein